MIKPAACLLSVMLFAAAAFADPPRPNESNSLGSSLIALDSRAPENRDVFVSQVGMHKLALREQALRLQQADGGTLTPAHRAYLQRKLDRINGS